MKRAQVQPSRPAATPPPIKRQPALWAVMVLAVAGLSLAWWSLSRKPSSATPAPAAPAPAASTPVPSHVERMRDAQARAQADQAAFAGQPTVAAWVAILNDNSQTMKARMQAARALAKEGSDAAFLALQQALTNPPVQLHGVLAEALASSRHPNARTVLEGLLKSPVNSVACGAVRGLAARQEPETLPALTGLLQDANVSLAVRTEAALALGQRNGPEALPPLIQIVRSGGDEALAASALEALGQRPLSETESFFRDYLSASNTPPGLRVSALEALGRAQGEVGPILASHLRDAAPEARAAAAWALSLAAEAGDARGPLLDALRDEPSPEVRMRLYEALGNQSQVDLDRLLNSVRKETEPETWLAGQMVLARQAAASPEVRDYFDQTAAPELRTLAVKGTSSPQRLRAVLALRAAKTPEALRHLQEILRQSPDPKVVEAARQALQLAPKP